MKIIIFAFLALLLSSSCLILAHSVAAYRLVITVKDMDSIPISEASVRVTTKWGADDYRDVTPILSTNSSGIVVYENVYSVEGQAHIRVTKSAVQLANGDYSLSYPVTYVTIICQGVASLIVHAVDSGNQSLQNAQVNLDWQGLDGVSWTLSQTTDDEGNTVFPQMNPYTYQVQVLWQGLPVHQGSFDFSEMSSNYTAHCNVHDLQVAVFDASNNSISDAKVTVTRSDQWKLPPKYTVEGFVIFPQLSASNYTIGVFYGTYSNVTTITLVTNQTLLIRISLFTTPTYDISIQTTWSDEKPAPAASVVVQDNEGDRLFSGITDPSGFATVELGEGAYTITVSKGNATKTQSATINDRTTTIVVILETAQRISRLTVEVYNEDQFAYGSTVELCSNGYSLCNLTAVDGMANFDLPDGTYAVIARYEDQTQTALVTLSEDIRLQMVFRIIGEFDSPITIITAIALSLVLFALLKMRAKRSKGQCFSSFANSIRQRVRLGSSLAKR